MQNRKARNTPRIEALSVKHYRVLRDVRLEPLASLATFLGPNGSGKTTLMDVFAFLAECVSDGLRKAWDRRGRFAELRSRGSAGPIVIELRYREQPNLPSITYHSAIDEGRQGPRVAEEWLEWQPDQQRRPFRFLEFKGGAGSVVAGDRPDEQGERAQEQLASPDTLAVGTLGQLARYPRVAALRQFIAGWYLSDPKALDDPALPPLMGIEMPEQRVYPQHLPELTEQFRSASAHSQVLVTTHSPLFVNGLRPEEVWALYRDERGYTQVRRAAGMRSVREFMQEGALLGNLWVEGHFEAGNLLSPSQRI